MSPPRRQGITARLVSLREKRAGDATVDGSVEERVALVARLSETSWALTRRPLPRYSRASMPVVVTDLKSQ